MSEKSPPTLEHQEPPVYYCWTYWTSDGEVREGCTPIEPKNHETWPDLNDYGWVYITIPIAVVFILIFIIYLVCSHSGKKSKTVQKQSLLVDDSDESDVDMEPAPKSKWSRFHSYPGNGAIHAVPVRKAKTEDFYTVVQMAKPDNNAAPNRKVPPRGGVTAPMYPQLSAMRRQQSGLKADEEVAVNGKRMYAKSPTSRPVSHYVNDPTRKKQPKMPSPKVEELSSSEYEITENEEQSDDDNVKET